MTTIDYYGTEDNYIHFKWGDCRKMYNFTKEFEKEYPKFSEEYEKYFNWEESIFTNPFDIVIYIDKFNIPVHFYANFTDEPINSLKEALEYLTINYQPDKLFKRGKNDKGEYCLIDLDGHFLILNNL